MNIQINCLKGRSAIFLTVIQNLSIKHITGPEDYFFILINEYWLKVKITLYALSTIFIVIRFITGLQKKHSDWKYSSYNAYLSVKPTQVNKEEGLSLFSSLEEFILFHKENKSAPGIEKYYFE